MRAGTPVRDVVGLDDARRQRADLVDELLERVADLVVDHGDAVSQVVATIVVGCA